MTAREMLERMAMAAGWARFSPGSGPSPLLIQAALRELLEEFADHSDEGTHYWGMDECIKEIVELKL